jgi:hypothetical protein
MPGSLNRVPTWRAGQGMIRIRQLKICAKCSDEWRAAGRRSGTLGLIDLGRASRVVNGQERDRSRRLL